MTSAAVARLRQALQETNAALDAGDYQTLAAKIGVVRGELAQVDRAFGSGGVDAAKAAAARQAVAALANACGTVERTLRSGAAVSEGELAAFLGGVKAALETLERSAN